MNKTTLIKVLAKRAGMTKVKSQEVVETLIDIATEVMAEGEKIELIGFGTLYPCQQTERMGRNPRTGVPAVIRARRTGKFKAGKGLIDALNQPKEA